MPSKAKNTAAATVTLVSSVVSLLESGIFALIAAQKLPADPKPLFGAFGVTAAAATLSGPFLEEETGKKVLRLIGYLPCAAMNTAIFFYEGPTASAIFTASLGAGEAILIAEMVYKGCKGQLGKADIYNFILETGKNAGILLTINLGGRGKIFELLKEKTFSLSHTIVSGVASGLALVGGLWRAKQGVEKMHAACAQRNEVADDNYAQLTGLEVQPMRSPMSIQ